MHILFNMLTVWMFGVDLERRWGRAAFTKYYFVTGVGAGICHGPRSLLPLGAAALDLQRPPTIGASGAVYGLLFAWALLFPNRQILFMFFFPLPARDLRAHHGRDRVPLGDRRERRPRRATSRTSAACSSAGSTSRARPICGSI